MNAPTYLYTGAFAAPDPARLLTETTPRLGEAAVMVADPARFHIGRLDPSGRIVDADGATIALDDAFEMRAFDGRVELRWLRRPDGGDAALLAEQPIPDLADTPVAVLDHLDRTELVWGEVIDGRHGWTRTHEARVGTLRLPVTIDTGQRTVALRIREYVTDGGPARDGNAVIEHQRLIGFEGVT